MPIIPRTNKNKAGLENSDGLVSLPGSHNSTNNTSEATKQRIHTSVGASTAFKACWAITGSEPQVMVASSANEKPSHSFCFFIFQTAFVYAASQ